jgi:hypothetical protein
MQCYVYRCARRAETFVYLARQDDFERIPAPVRVGLGALSLVTSFDLDARQRLAREDIAVVRSNLRQHGLHIQFPPDIAALHAQG